MEEEKKSHKDKSPKKASCIQIYKTYVQVMNLLYSKKKKKL